MLSSKSFIVSGLTFRSLIHFEFIFVYGVRECSVVFQLFLLYLAVVDLSFVKKTFCVVVKLDGHRICTAFCHVVKNLLFHSTKTPGCQSLQCILIIIKIRKYLSKCQYASFCHKYNLFNMTFICFSFCIMNHYFSLILLLNDSVSL